MVGYVALSKIHSPVILLIDTNPLFGFNGPLPESYAEWETKETFRKYLPALLIVGGID